MSRKYTQYKGQISQVELHKELSKAQIFVLNSVFESFSLAVIEALNCGCSVLVSNVAGVTDLLKLKECDVILNPNDRAEIASKIDYLLEHPNCNRLSEFIDYDKFSYVAQVSRITHICSEL